MLWNLQILVENFLKLTLHEARPSLMIPTCDPDCNIPWTPFNQIISLGSPCGTALSSSCVALSIAIEYVYYTEEQSEHSKIKLTMTHSTNMLASTDTSILDDDFSMRQSGEIVKYPLHKKILLVCTALIYATICSFARFAIGAHSLD